MYVALFNISLSNITILPYAIGDLTTKVYDFDTIKLSGKDNVGVSEETLQTAKIFTLNEDDGQQIYAGFVYKIEKKDETITIFGEDFRKLLDTEIVMDFVSRGYPITLSDLFQYVIDKVFDNTDVKVNSITMLESIPTDTTQIRSMLGDYTGTYRVVNAYKFLQPYIKYYGYMIRSDFDWSTNSITITFDNTFSTHSIKLKDFEYDLSRNEPKVNKVIVGYYSQSWREEDYDTNRGEWIPTGTYLITDTPPSDTSTTRYVLANDKAPLPMKYYYLDKDNNIVDSDEVGNISNRYYPVRCKQVYEEYLADAQFTGVLELANQRYKDLIYIDANSPLNPIDLSTLALFDMVELYDNNLFKTIPIAEKQLKISDKGEDFKLKLGFKKDKLNEILKGSELDV